MSPESPSPKPSPSGASRPEGGRKHEPPRAVGAPRAEPSRPEHGAGRAPEEARSDGGPRTITKKELVARIAERTGQTKVVARDVIQLFLDQIIDELGRGNRLEFREFGVFEIKERAARKAQNPRTLEKVDVPSKRVVKFRVGRTMKQRVGEIPEGSEHIADGSDAYDDDDDDYDDED